MRFLATRGQGMTGTCAAIALIAGTVPSSPISAGELDLISIDRIESLCSSAGSSAFVLGKPRSPEARAALEGSDGIPAVGEAPFVEAWPTYTAWSDRLAKIAWYPDFKEPVKATDWLDRMTEVLKAGGWQEVDPDFVSALPEWRTPEFTKEFAGDEVPTTIQIQVEAVSSYRFECTTPQLARLHDDEAQGILEPGTQRPLAPALIEKPQLDPAICDTPEFQELMTSNRKLEESGFELGEIIPVVDPDNEAMRYGERLRTWLVWRMTGSGKVDWNRVWEIEEAVAPPQENEQLASMLGFLADAGEMIRAEEDGEKVRSCRLMLEMAGKQREKNAEAVARLDKINTALEAEARRLGIPLD